MSVRIQAAVPADVPVILQLIRELAEFERLLHEATATEEQLRQWLFGPQPKAEVVIARVEEEVAGFALYFHNFSTFLGRKGLWLEDLFVRPAYRHRGYGKALLLQLAPRDPGGATQSRQGRGLMQIKDRRTEVCY